MTAKLDEIKRLKDQYTAAVKEAGVDAIREFFAPLFEANPTILGFRWQQYTPYFNDGEPCVFRVYDLECRVANAEPGEDEDGWLSEWDMAPRDAWTGSSGTRYPARAGLAERAAFGSAVKAFRAIPSDVLHEAGVGP